MRDFSFLTYPVIKMYRLADETTGKLSSRRIDFYNIPDGPTGVEYTEKHFPCWVVSAGALATLLAGGYALLFGGRSRKGK